MNEHPSKTRLNFDSYFYELRDEVFCLVKIPKEFPRCRKGGDLDLFCYNIDSFGKRLLNLGQKDIRLLNIEIEISKVTHDHWHIDFMDKKLIEFRFDLYGSIPHYRNIRIKSALFESIIENAVPLCRKWGELSYELYVPSTIDDMIIRYLEYCEYYRESTDKIHHLDYIQSFIKQENYRIDFFEKLHHYTDFPDYDELLAKKPPSQMHKGSISSLAIKNYIRALFKAPILQWPIIIALSLKRFILKHV